MDFDMVTRLCIVYPFHVLFVRAWSTSAVLIPKLHHELAKGIVLKDKRLFGQALLFPLCLHLLEWNLVATVFCN